MTLVVTENRMANGPLTEPQQLVLWLGALRYYLGRSTGAVHEFCEMLIATWPALSMNVRALVQRDIEEAFARDDIEWDHVAARTPFGEKPVRPLNMPLGQECDWQAWRQVRALWRPFPTLPQRSSAAS